MDLLSSTHLSADTELLHQSVLLFAPTITGEEMNGQAARIGTQDIGLTLSAHEYNTTVAPQEAVVHSDIEAGEGEAGVFHPVLLVIVAVGGIAAGAQDAALVLNLTEDQQSVIDSDLVLVHKEIDTLLIEEGRGRGTGILWLPDLRMQALMTTKTRVK